MTIICKGSEAGQSESLVSRLRGLIRDYPAGIGIVKEFLQNADDAGGTWLRLTLDLRNHRAERIPDSRMAPLLGPALLVESDQVFTDDDLRNIQTIGEGGKLGEATKTGRFGLGFNTSYNLTDYPCFATRDRVICFDPNEDAVAVGGRPGRQWGLIDLWRNAPDWPRAFGLADGASDLSHTVFRLPLRTPTQARPDRICVHPFLPEEVEAIFAEAAICGGSLLLFLHRILDLEARILRADGSEVDYLSVRTGNREEVNESRSRVIAACAGRVEDLISRWTTKNVDLPVEVYEHRFLASG